MTTAKPSASEQARAWLALSPLVLDTETTVADGRRKEGVC